MTTTTKYAYLRMVTVENNNKMYEMVDNADGTFTAFWGRMTGDHEQDKKSAQSKVYPMSQWESTFRSKVKKGYKDATEYRSVKTIVESKNSNGDTVISNDKHVNDIISALQSYALQQTTETYSIKAADVTQKMIDDAQAQVDKMNNLLKDFGTKHWSLNLFNVELLRLFEIIPRKMKNVKDHLMTEKRSNETDKEYRERFESMLEDEQSNIDSMAGLVAQMAAQATDDNVQTNNSLLDSLGIEMSLVTDKKVIEEVKKYAQDHSHRVKRIFSVVNKETQKAYDKQLSDAKDKKTELMWHGSRRQNWWFIIQQGLRIRPSGAIHNGSMFGDGIYFASEADKSMGYTDGHRWTGGSRGGHVYMALYSVHLGKQYCIKSSDSSLSADKLKRLGDYDSTWGQKGPNLYRHEYITYKSSQSTIKYLVEFEA